MKSDKLYPKNAAILFHNRRRNACTTAMSVNVNMNFSKEKQKTKKKN